MNYENKPCPACGAHLHESDDVVVCPVCATPQHRSCWMENGRCINEEKHAEGYVWSPDKGSADTFEQSIPQDDSGVKICHICGSENPSEALHCGACGAVLGETEAEKEPALSHCNNCGLDNEPGSPFCKRCGAPLNTVHFNTRGFNPFVNVAGTDESEKIGNHTAAELAVYIRTSVRKYLDKFRRIEGGKKLNFNWAAFIFGSLWYFYRKMYKAGALFVVCIAAATLIAASSASEFAAVYQSYNAKFYSGELSQAETEALYQEYMAELQKIDKKPVYVFMGIAFTVHLLCGLLAYNLYYKKIIDDFKLISEQVEDRNMQAMLISRRGGVSFLNAICGYFFFELVVNVLAWIAQYISDRF